MPTAATFKPFTRTQPKLKVALWCPRDQVTFVAFAGARCPKCKGPSEPANLKKPDKRTVQTAAPAPAIDAKPAAQGTEADAIAATVKQWEKDHPASGEAHGA